MSGDGLAPASFSTFERRLVAYLVALWRLRPPIRPAGPVDDGLPARRVGIADDRIRVPDQLAGAAAGGAADPAADLYRAALVHAGAHLRFSGPRFPVGGLKPLQVALVSLIEDARVEHLAMREHPGLIRVWRPFHVAEAGGTATAPGLMARLARALIDPGHADDDAWIAKGRRLFFDGRAEWGDPAISRRIGGLLGNDLGQMRLSFNARTHVVEPAYRDDNLGLWDYGETPQAPPGETETRHDAFRSEREERDHGPPDDSPPPDRSSVTETAARPVGEEEAVAPPVHYPEWDDRIGLERPNWTRLVERAAGMGEAAIIHRAVERHDAAGSRLAALVRAAGAGRPEWRRRQPEGDRLDLDACIDAVVARRHGAIPDSRIHAASRHRPRDLSVLLLLDVSASTGDRVPGGTRPILAVERDAAALLAQALDRIGDPFAIHAFRSNGRQDVGYYRIKDFGQAYDDAARARLAGLRAGLSTRLGTALRHGGRLLARQPSHRRLLLVVTDGAPSDIDTPDRRLLVEDARRAVLALPALGIDAFAVGLDPGGRGYLSRMFGARNLAIIDRPERLPDVLPSLVLALSR